MALQRSMIQPPAGTATMVSNSKPLDIYEAVCKGMPWTRFRNVGRKYRIGTHCSVPIAWLR